jgi:hypothetical protein
VGAEYLIGSFLIILEIFIKKTLKFRSKAGLQEEYIYITKSFKEIGTLGMPVSLVYEG